MPTRFARTVVTDDQGRYLVPDLPAGHYKVWVRGYGLVDSAKPMPSRQAAQPDGDDYAERCRRRATLSGDLLVLDAEDPGR